MPVSKIQLRFLLISLALVIAVVTAALYRVRSSHCVLYYFGAAPEEVPQGTAIAILNPLRNRGDENNAGWVIRDLRTAKCEQVSRELHGDPVRICSTMRDNHEATLVWLDPENDAVRGSTRRLIYNLPYEKARLVICFGPDDSGWLVKTVSLVR